LGRNQAAAQALDAHDILLASYRQFFDFLRQYAAESSERKLYEDFVL